MAADAERHLLFGLIALQVGLIDQSQLVAAFQSWARDKSRPLSDHLSERGVLDANGRAAIEAMVELHLRRNVGDIEKSLVSLPVGQSTRELLDRVCDADLDASLQHLASCSTERDADRTATFSVGTSTADGQRFRVLRPHARGGLGAVFVALDDELHREVALKQILDEHADDPSSRQRFLLEAEITGGLEHPGIVPVYGLGTYAGGRPFYAMRFIRGDSLADAIAAFHAHAGLRVDPTRYSLELRNLLRRFTDVCNALAYAHARGVLHRDIKPGNIIVGKYGETLVVDWGLAKALGHSDPIPGERTLMPASATGSPNTLPGSALGTPAYMSPEQARGDLDALGPRSDVYSLGATLYCLLTGKPPFEGDDLGVLLQQVQKGNFPRPRQFDTALDPALEAVCLRAMALTPADRYFSARALADDIDRWLADEPVTAYPEPFTRRARRWGKRNRTLVASGAATLVMAAVGLGVVSAVQTKARNDLTAKNIALDLQRQRAEANESQAIDTVKRFRDAVANDPVLKDNPELDALRKRLLKEPLVYFRALRERLQVDRDTHPESLVRLAKAMHDYAHLAEEIGDVQDGLRSHEESLAIWERLTAEHREKAEHQSGLAKLQNCRGNMLLATGKLAEARKAFEAALAILQKLADAHPALAEYQSELARSHHSLGVLLRDNGAPREARKAYEAATAIIQKLADAHPTVTRYQSELATTNNNLGNLLSETGAPAEARKAYDAALAIQQKLADTHPADTDFQSDLARSQFNLGNLLSDTGAPAEARKANEEALAIRQKLAEAHPTVTLYQSDLAESHFNLGRLLSLTGAPAEARTAYEAALAIWQKLADAHPTVIKYQSHLAQCHINLGTLLHSTDTPAEARKACDAALAILQKLADAHPTVTQYQSDLAMSQNNLSALLSATGAPAEARKASEAALAIRQKLADAHPTVTQYQSDLAMSQNNLGYLMSATGAPAEARKAYEEAVAILRKLADAHPTVTQYQSDLAMSQNNLGYLMSAAGAPAEARKAYEAAVAILQKLADAHPTFTDYQSDLSRNQNSLGNLLSGTGAPVEARKAYDAALAIRQKLVEAHPTVTLYQSDLAESHFNLGRLLSETGAPAEARTAYEAALAIQQKLAEAHPTVIKYQSDLAGSHFNLGTLLSATGGPAEARKAYEAALAIWQKLADAHPTVAEHQSYLASCHNSIGKLLSVTGAPAEARKAYDASLAIWQKLADTHPTVAEHQSNLASGHFSIGNLLSATGAPAEARKAYDASLAIRQKLADAHPSVTEYQGDLASNHSNLGALLRHAGAPAEARKAFEAAVAIQQRLSREHPESPKYASDIGASLNNMALLDNDARRFSEARVLLQQAIDWQKKALTANPRNPTYRQFLANHLSNLITSARGLGRYDEAAAAQRELAELSASNPQFAAAEARLAALMKGQAPKDNAERLALAQRAYDTARYATAARLWAEALDADPKLAESRQTQHCYNAACAAALAGSGKAIDDPGPSDAAKPKLRQQAHIWLKSELGEWSKLLQSESPERRGAIAQILQHWQVDTDLAGVRETDALQELPDEERKAWNALWAEVKELFKKRRALALEPSLVSSAVARVGQVDRVPVQNNESFLGESSSMARPVPFSIAQRLLESVLAVGNQQKGLAERRQAFLEEVAHMIDADAGWWAWGRGRPNSSTVAPVAVIYLVHESERQQGLDRR